MKPLARPAAICFLTAALLLAAPASAKEKWRHGKSEHFEVFSNATPNSIEETVVELEAFRAAFISLFKIPDQQVRPIVVYIFRSNRSFRKYAPTNEKGNVGPIGGIFSEEPDQCLIALHLEGDDTKRVIYHEYIHYLLSLIHGNTALPLWYNEGVAELYSTFTIEDNLVEFGQMIPSHVRFLTYRGVMPMEELFATRQISHDFGDLFNTYTVYTQSWAFQHYCTFGKDQACDEEMAEFISKIEPGVNTEAIFQEVFQMEYDEMEKKILQHVTWGRYLLHKVKFKELDVDSGLELDLATPLQENYFLGNLLARFSHPDTALPLLEEAVKLAPEWPLPYESLGLAAVTNKNWALAQEHFLEAEERKSSNPLVYYYLAVLKPDIDEPGTTIPYNISEKDRAYMIRNLITAIRINPLFPQAYHRLADVLLGANKISGPELLEFVKEGLRNNPRNSSLAFKIAQLEIKSNYPDRARETLKPFLALEYEDHIREQAEKLWLETGTELP